MASHGTGAKRILMGGKKLKPDPQGWHYTTHVPPSSSKPPIPLSHPVALPSCVLHEAIVLMLRAPLHSNRSLRARCSSLCEHTPKMRFLLITLRPHLVPAFASSSRALDPLQHAPSLPARSPTSCRPLTALHRRRSLPRHLLDLNPGCRRCCSPHRCFSPHRWHSRIATQKPP